MNDFVSNKILSTSSVILIKIKYEWVILDFVKEFLSGSFRVRMGFLMVDFLIAFLFVSDGEFISTTQVGLLTPSIESFTLFEGCFLLFSPLKFIFGWW